MKFPLVGAELFHADARADRHDEANSRFSQLCQRAYKKKLLHFFTKYLLGNKIYKSKRAGYIANTS